MLFASRAYSQTDAVSKQLANSAQLVRALPSTTITAGVVGTFPSGGGCASFSYGNKQQRHAARPALRCPCPCLPGPCVTGTCCPIRLLWECVPFPVRCRAMERVRVSNLFLLYQRDLSFPLWLYPKVNFLVSFKCPLV